MNVDCPLCLVDYNKYMGGVDRGDQLSASYPVSVKSRQYYKYIFWFLFEIYLFSFDIANILIFII